MKKLFTLLVLCALAFGLNAQKKVIYFSLDKNMGATLSSVENDPFLVSLKQDPNFIVDTIIFRVNYSNKKFYKDTVSFDNYDVIVVQEFIGGGDSVFSGRGLLGIENLTKPTLYNKTYTLRNKRAFNVGKNVNPSVTNGGSMGSETLSNATTGLLTSLKVATGKENHNIFKGIPLTDGKFQVFDTTAADAARVGNKALNYAIFTKLSDENTLLAYPDGVLGTYNTATPPVLTTAHVPKICINDIPQGTVLTDTLNGVTLTTAARMITVGLNSGAMSSRGGTNLRPEGLKLLTNAVYILSGLNIPDASPIIKKTDGFSIVTRGNQFEIQLSKSQKTSLTVHSITGKLIEKRQINGSNAIVNLEGKAKGIYLINAGGVSRKVTVK